MSPLVPYTKQGESFDFSRKSPGGDRQHLLYSVPGEIRLHLDGEEREYVIVKDLHWGGNLAIHDNRVVHTDANRIIYTEDGETITRPDTVRVIAVHKNQLVHAEDYHKGQPNGSRILYTKTGELIARRPEGVWDLAVHDGRLVDAGNYEKIFYTEEHRPAAKSYSRVRALAVHDGRLVDANIRNIQYSNGTRIRIASRLNDINALAVYNGLLIDAGYYGKVFYTEKNEQILETDNPIFSLLPIDEKTASRLLTLPEVREIR
jgi:hypothetical protein